MLVEARPRDDSAHNAAALGLEGIQNLQLDVANQPFRALEIRFETAIGIRSRTRGRTGNAIT
jgi:hypothetical protein